MKAPALSARHDRAPRAGVLLGVLAAVLLALAAGPSAALSNGETVHLRGAVADPQGRPMAGLAVTLTASRSYFSLRRMQSAEASARTVSTTTDNRGRYALDWPWDEHYNHFELALGIPLHGAGGGQGAHGDRVEPLASEDVSDRLTGAAGAAVDLPFTVQNAAYVEKVRRFAATLASDDERRVYAEMGHPDEVKSVRYPDHDEVSWWYFASGKAYRFESGKLAQVVPFDPIKPF